MQTHAPRMDPPNLASVTVRPAPRLVAGYLSFADLRAVGDWIGLNEAVLVDYWYGRIYTDELLQRLRPLSPAIPP